MQHLLINPTSIHNINLTHYVALKWKHQVPLAFPKHKVVYLSIYISICISVLDH